MHRIVSLVGYEHERNWHIYLLLPIMNSIFDMLTTQTLCAMRKGKEERKKNQQASERKT
jgi:hypothetical protein